MTDYDKLEEQRQMTRSNYAAQMAMLGYDASGNPLDDIVRVVRCRDCVYYNTTGCGTGFGWCEDAVVNTGVWDDFYCADGERRDDDAAD